MAAGEETDDALKPFPRNKGCLRNWYNRRMLGMNLVVRRRSLIHASPPMMATPDFESEVSATARCIHSRNGDGPAIGFKG